MKQNKSYIYTYEKKKSVWPIAVILCLMIAVLAFAAIVIMISKQDKTDSASITVYTTAQDSGEPVSYIDGRVPYYENVEKNRSTNRVKRQKNGYGFNAATEKYEDMIAAGIVDPAKVTRSALQNAASASAMLLTTESGIYDIDETESAATATQPPSMGGMSNMGGLV